MSELTSHSAFSKQSKVLPRPCPNRSDPAHLRNNTWSIMLVRKWRRFIPPARGLDSRPAAIAKFCKVSARSFKGTPLPSITTRPVPMACLSICAGFRQLLECRAVEIVCRRASRAQARPGGNQRPLFQCQFPFAPAGTVDLQSQMDRRLIRGGLRGKIRHQPTGRESASSGHANRTPVPAGIIRGQPKLLSIAYRHIRRITA